MRSIMTETGMFGFKGKTFFYHNIDKENNRPEYVCKALTSDELALIDDVPAILYSHEALYRLLTSNLKKNGASGRADTRPA